MEKIKLKEVNSDNFSEVIKLSDTLDDMQKKCVAPNVISLAQAYVNYEIAYPRAIYLGDKPIGFVMLSLHDDDIDKLDQPAYFLWRFMIAKEYQNQGFGKMTLDLIVDKCRKDGKKYLYTSCDIESNMPYDFYINYGFLDTKEMDDDELILKLKI
jgi:diamine N-acetyltransferase